jgi:hypothetical protein
MADFVFNIAKGHVNEYASRVNANDPVNSVLNLSVLATSGIESDAVLIDKDTLADVVSGTTNFVTNTGYARIEVDNTGSITVTVDDTNDRKEADMPDQTWSAVLAGDGWNDLVIGYDSDSTGGTDANIVPCTQHDFVVTPDGSDITVQFNAAGFFRAA